MCPPSAPAVPSGTADGGWTVLYKNANSCSHVNQVLLARASGEAVSRASWTPRLQATCLALSVQVPCTCPVHSQALRSTWKSGHTGAIPGPRGKGRLGRRRCPDSDLRSSATGLRTGGSVSAAVSPFTHPTVTGEEGVSESPGSGLLRLGSRGSQSHPPRRSLRAQVRSPSCFPVTGGPCGLNPGSATDRSCGSGRVSLGPPSSHA